MALTGQGERGEKAELTPVELLEKDLRDNYESNFLEPGVVYEFPRPRNPGQTMGSECDLQTGVSQELELVIKAGKEFYFLVDTSTRFNKSEQLKRPEYVRGTFLARFNPDSTAQVVDYSAGWVFEGTTTRALNAKIRREGSDVSVAQDVEGVVGIVDEGSKNWIEIFKQKTPEEHDPEIIADESIKPNTLNLGGGSSWQIDSQQVFDKMKWSLKG
ncbi:MAG: hypothetical protein NTV39_00195 [Candidatus Saccharibacteria bacterium]|nr:hypothetical protein [Candidatus Saccharibacteria bacterium]